MAAWKQLGVALVAVLGVLMPGEARPCVFVRDTTWGLTGKAERIVLGRVVRTWSAASLPEDDFAPPSGTADTPSLPGSGREAAVPERVDVEVLEVWKGAPAERLTVVTTQYWDELGDVLERAGSDHRLLLFLSLREEAWQTTDAFSHELLAPEDVATWREMVTEAVALQAHPPVKAEARLDWNVLATVSPSTRTEALEDIFPDWSIWDRDWSAPIRLPTPHPLSPAAQQRIATHFVSRPRTPFLWQLLLALHGHADAEVDRLAIRQLEEELAREDIHKGLLLETQDAIDLLSFRLGVSGAGTERCRLQVDTDTEALAAAARCVRARWERIRALHAAQAH
ncbi:hypothetical protein ACLESD_45760 [Pyxidicoccus sp. 3LFB2]